MYYIGETARISGVSAKQIRYYESIGLLSKTRRQENGYRVYDERQVHELRFIKSARQLGFPIKQVRELLNLWRNKRRASSKVRALAERHRDAIEERMNGHLAIVEVLNRLIEKCSGDERPDCPIIDELSR
ncbi:MAG: Cu(I)-responsive transcriptional regulator [Hyphomicrobiaceae bacterium]